MDKKRLLELAGVEISEAAAPKDTASRRAFSKMSQVYNQLERIQVAVNNAKGDMHEANLGAEHKAVLASVEKACDALETFLAGLEMQAKDEK